MRKAAKEGQKGTQEGRKGRQPGIYRTQTKSPGKRPKRAKEAKHGRQQKAQKRSSSQAGPRQPRRAARVAIALPFAEQPNSFPNGAGRQSGQDASERVLNEFAARAVPGGRWFLLDKYRPAIACHLLSKRSRSK